MALRVKICGVTRVEDARACVDAGVDAIGLNFWPRSKRFVTPEAARPLADVVRGRVRIVGLFVDAEQAHIESVREAVGLDCVQLHGDEPPDALRCLLPNAFKALRVRGAEIEQEAARYAGEILLLDAYVPGMPGGTGAQFDWQLAGRIARQRKVVVAGGLSADNVADAVRAVRPYGVDTASGVESAPGLKDAELIARFVRSARGA